MDKEDVKFVACIACKGTGVHLNCEQCPTCCGFGTLIVYEEQENETSI